jgi:biopolymer transport protein ExbB/biopolymer transport protein TolQ
MALATIGITALLVQRDFFLPRIFFREQMKARQFLAATWVLAVTGSAILFLIAAFRVILNGASWVSSQLSTNTQGLPKPESLPFSPMNLWEHMGWLGHSVAIILFIESIWSLAVMIDRYLYFSAARKQSREFAPKVAGALKDSKLEEAIRIADRNKKSHLAEVVTAGLQEFRASGGTATEETIARSDRALEIAEAIVHAKLKRGLAALATIGATAPFVGLFGTVVGILNAFWRIANQKTTSTGAVAGGISDALVATAFGLLVAIPAVLAFNYFTGRVEAFDEEIDNSSSELVDYFIKQSHKR